MGRNRDLHKIFFPLKLQYQTIGKDIQMEKLFSCRTAATHYSMSEAYFRKYLKLKEIKAIKIGYNIRMKQSDLEEFFLRKGISIIGVAS